MAPSRATLPSRPETEARLSISLTAPSEKVTLCALAGEVDYYTADQFRSQLIGSLSTAGPLVVIDLSQVTFFGVAGLHVLIEARAWAGHTERRIRLVTGPRCVDRLLEVAGDAATFDTAANLADAVLDAA
ncbi:STAS domain-containing protein [Nocardia sp. CA-128927]|uniref:STAS domain-containing protein n=1 Tax=Nocardia sp. CA-128927 TaxID=3239975 RepID=UPI003D9823BF